MLYCSLCRSFFLHTISSDIINSDLSFHVQSLTPLYLSSNTWVIIHLREAGLEMNSQTRYLKHL